MVGFMPEFYKFIVTFVICIITANVAAASGSLVSTISPSVDVGLVIAPTLTVMVMLFGGGVYLKLRFVEESRKASERSVTSVDSLLSSFWAVSAAVEKYTAHTDPTEEKVSRRKGICRLTCNALYPAVACLRQFVAV